MYIEKYIRLIKELRLKIFNPKYRIDTSIRLKSVFCEYVLYSLKYFLTYTEPKFILLSKSNVLIHSIKYKIKRYLIMHF